jgi:hypothetical protein
MQQKIKSKILRKTIISTLCDINRDFFYPKLRLELIRLVIAIPKAQKITFWVEVEKDYADDFPDYEKSSSIEEWQVEDEHGNYIGTRFKFNEKSLYELFEKEVTWNWRDAYGGDISIVIDLADMTIHLESSCEFGYPGDDKKISIA